MNRVLNYDQYVIEPVAPGVGRAHNGAIALTGHHVQRVAYSVKPLVK